MLNQVYIVGRLDHDPELENLNDNVTKKVCNMTLAIPRKFKNENGKYDTDLVDCIALSNIAENIKEYCHKGDLIGVSGRVQMDTYENEKGEKIKTIKLVAEKVSFLSSKPLDKEEKEEQEMER